MNKKYKPLVDKLFWIISVPTILLVIGAIIISIYHAIALIIMSAVAAFVLYFFVSPLFGYVELRENSMFIKYGFILKKEIPYSKIRSVTKARKFYSDSMMSLKNSFDHVNIKYNTFDVTCVSVVDNDSFINELSKRL